MQPWLPDRQIFGSGSPDCPAFIFACLLACLSVLTLLRHVCTSKRLLLSAIVCLVVCGSIGADHESSSRESNVKYRDFERDLSQIDTSLTCSTPLAALKVPMRRKMTSGPGVRHRIEKSSTSWTQLRKVVNDAGAPLPELLKDGWISNPKSYCGGLN